VITKRIVGITLASAGLVIVIGMMAIDWIGAGNWGGIGPAQRLAIIVGVVISILGLTLLPLGNKPA
jgi:hypothetical protein